MGVFKKHKWGPLCCRLCEKRAGVPRRYDRAADRRTWKKST